MSVPLSVPVRRQDLADIAWAAVQKMEKFGYGEISVATGISHRTVGRLVRTWQNEGRLIVIRPPGLRQRGIWRIDPDFAPKPAVPARTAEECLWTAMRQSRSFTPRILAANAATPDIEVTLEMAQAYCRALLAAGYLSVTRKAVPGKHEPLYRLIKNSGPRPPREKRVRAVVDDNLETVTVIGGGQ